MSDARRATIALLLLALVAGALWFWRQRPGPHTTPTGAAVGPLPRPIAPSDLNLLLVTLPRPRR